MSATCLKWLPYLCCCRTRRGRRPQRSLRRCTARSVPSSPGSSTPELEALPRTRWCGPEQCRVHRPVGGLAGGEPALAGAPPASPGALRLACEITVSAQPVRPSSPVDRMRHFAGVAQSVEQLTRNEQVRGSNPLSGSQCDVARHRGLVSWRHARDVASWLVGSGRGRCGVWRCIARRSSGRGRCGPR